MSSFFKSCILFSLELQNRLPAAMPTFRVRAMVLYSWRRENSCIARAARPRISVNFHKFSPCMRARGFDSLPSPRTSEPLAIHEKIIFDVFASNGRINRGSQLPKSSNVQYFLEAKNTVAFGRRNSFPFAFAMQQLLKQRGVGQGSTYYHVLLVPWVLQLEWRLRHGVVQLCVQLYTRWSMLHGVRILSWQRVL
jgi:hypothetical protein